MTLLYPLRQQQLQSLMHKLGLRDCSALRWDLLDLALTHPSVSMTANYEQLEFVGDAVVRLVVAEFLLETRAELPVGEFAAIRSALVSDRTLARLAAQYGFARYLLMSNSALNDKLGQESRLAATFEAVLGALYLSTHSLELIRPWLDAHLQELTVEVRSDPARLNYKAALQEWTQAHYKALPEYRVVQSGIVGAADCFTAEVWFREQQLGLGTGRSIKTAEQAAAKVAYHHVCHDSERLQAHEPTH